MENNKADVIDELTARQTPETPRGSATEWEQRLVHQLLRMIGEPAIHITLWDSTKIQPPHGQPRAGMIFRNRAALWRLLLGPRLGFGDQYSLGQIEIEGGLVELMTAVLQARKPYRTRSLVEKIVIDGLRPLRKNTLHRSRRNIHHHYDIGNDFYRLWLDEEMAYTCAYFPDPDMTLEAAQIAKMDHVCRKLRLQPGERVAEAGCGWGSLALHMARHYGVTVKAYNISHEQISAAQKRAQAEGLADRVEYIEDDFRNIQGEYDAFVSVGMLEHVGLSNYETLGGIIERVLTPTGRGLIHTIGQDKPQPMTSWIEKRIFPGAYPPTLSQIMAIFEPYSFTVQDVENLRPHYAKTCQHWLTRFEEHEDQVEAMFDQQFVRMWRLYLCSAIAGFDIGALQLFQVLFSRRADGRLPWSRADLYPASGTQG